MSLAVIDTACVNGRPSAENTDLPTVARIGEIASPRIVPNDTENILSGVLTEPNPYLAFAGISLDDPFAEEVDAYIVEQRRREREEAASEADT